MKFRAAVNVATPLVAGVTFGLCWLLVGGSIGTALGWGLLIAVALGVVHLLQGLLMLVLGALTRRLTHRRFLPQRLRWLIRILLWALSGAVTAPAALWLAFWPTEPNTIVPQVGLVLGPIAAVLLSFGYCVASAVVLTLAERRSRTVGHRSASRSATR